MKDTYKALLIKRKSKSNKLIFEIVNIDKKESLNILYDLLQCERIDIQERFINNKIYDFIFDDEYLINGKSQKPKNAVAIGTRKNELLEIIFGNLIICGIANEKGEETDLNDSDINNILSALKDMEHTPTKKSYQTIIYNFEKEN